jgi:hypothetical protein
MTPLLFLCRDIFRQKQPEGAGGTVYMKITRRTQLREAAFIILFRADYYDLEEMPGQIRSFFEDEDEFSEANWKTTKADRLIDALDASRILAYYARVQTGQPKDITTWNAVLGR